MVFHFYKDGSYVGASSSNVDQRRAEAIAARHGWTIGEAPAEPIVPIAERRAAASLTRAQFLRACVSASIITAEVAEEAATGKWPAAFDTFLRGLTSDQRIDAKATWADAGSVRRNNEILALIAADQNVSDAQLDAMFGIVN